MSELGERPSERLGRCGSYELLVELASGGMATVYLARAADGRDAPLVAIKRPHRHLANDKGFLTMLVDEARLASSIRHDNVVKVRELGFASGEPFIAMDYIEGASLADVRRELSALGRALDSRFALRIALDALAGLHAAHVLRDESGKHLGIVHRDVSPHNVLIGCDGVSRLTDFGIAKASDRVQVTRTHEVKGKIAYLAPERIDKRRMCTPQSDVFSMAVVLWESCAGRRLFRGDEALQTLQEVLTGPIPSLRKIGVPISQALDDAILRGLARDLGSRYPSAAAFADALAQAAGPGNVATPSEIASLVEALFGERLRLRHAMIREAIGAGDAEHVLEVSGLHARPEPTAEMRARERLRIESIAPPAPSARYAFGAASENVFQRSLATPAARAIAALVAALVLVAVVVIVLARRRSADAEVVVSVAAEPTIRHVVVPLPFVASRVTFDEQARELSPPADVAAFDVPRESGSRHRVTALADDGSRAEAFVQEANGVAEAEGAGFTIEEGVDLDDAGAAEPQADTVIELPATPAGVRRRYVRPRRHVAAASAPAHDAAAKPIATVKDGFTKLR